MINFVLLLFFHLSLSILSIYVIWSNRSFESLIKVFVSLISIHFLLIYLQIGTPIALLYGPMIFILQQWKTKSEKSKLQLCSHLAPFITMTIFYTFLYYAKTTGSAWKETLLIYYPIYFFCIILSLFGYGIYAWQYEEDAVPNNQDEQSLILQFSFINFIVAVFIGILLLSVLGVLDDDFIGFNCEYIIYGMLLLSLSVMTVYLIRKKWFPEIQERLKDDKNTLSKYNSSQIEDSTFKEYMLILESAIQEKKIHLQSSISLDKLSAETGIPKHHFSQLFNVYLGKTFYQYIAEQRIQEAIIFIERDDNITLESLAYECGFNSKSSFNRYFKSITGMTPTEYRSNCKISET